MKIVKKWMEKTTKSGNYNRAALQGLGKTLKTWMREKYDLDMPPGEEWDNLYWNEAKKFNKDQRNKLMGLTGKKWRRRIIGEAARNKERKELERQQAADRAADEPHHARAEALKNLPA